MRNAENLSVTILGHSRLRADARGCDGGVRQGLTAGIGPPPRHWGPYTGDRRCRPARVANQICRNGGLAVIDPGLAVPIECGRPVRKRSHALELAGVRLRAVRAVPHPWNAPAPARAPGREAKSAPWGARRAAMHASDAWFGSAGSISFIPSTRLPWHFVGRKHPP